jgi:hypothetical protein
VTAIKDRGFSFFFHFIFRKLSSEQPSNFSSYNYSYSYSYNYKLHSLARGRRRRMATPSPRMQSLNPKVALESAYTERESLANDNLSDDEFASDSGSSHTSHTAGGTAKPKQRKGRFAKLIKGAVDTRLEVFGVTWFDFAAISCARLIFLLALMAAAAGLTFSVFQRLSDEETANFESDVRTYITVLVLERTTTTRSTTSLPATNIKFTHFSLLFVLL